MLNTKKEIRRNFRNVCLKRDKETCRLCKAKCPKDKTLEEFFDVHHITDRSLMTSGGYVLENGITLCHPCHFKAEQFHMTGISAEGASPDDLYKLIGSSFEKAVEASKKL